MREHIDLGLQYKTPGWASFMDYENVSALMVENDLIRWKFHGIASSIESVRRHHQLPEGMQRIFEFGSGGGSGLVALDLFARSVGTESVTGSERTTGVIEYLEQLVSILPTVEAITQDGNDHLADSPDTYDLIYANMFGPSYFEDDEALGRNFLRGIDVALTDAGVAIINSDEETMAAMEVFAAEELDRKTAQMMDPSLFHGPNVYLPHMFVA